MARSLDFVAVGCMLSWFTLSSTIAIVNKYIFSNLEFPFPISLTAYHMLAQGILGVLATRFSLLGAQKPSLSTREYMRSIVPLGGLLSAEICFNNLGVRYVPVSFAQTVRSLTPLCAAIVTRIVFAKKLSRTATLTLFPVCFGVCLSTYDEPLFHLGGFCATIFSCFLTAGKLAATSVLLDGSFKMDPITALGLLSPVGFATLSPVAVALEGPAVLRWFARHRLGGAEASVVLFSGLCAVGLNVSMFFLVKRTSALAVAVAGNLKVIVIVVTSVLIFKNPISHVGMAGCAIAVSGCAAYGLVKDKYEV